MTPKYDNEGNEIGVTYDETFNEYTISKEIRIPTHQDYVDYDVENNTTYAVLYQTKYEFVPGVTVPTLPDFPADWTDEPQDVGPNEPVEWVAIRRYDPETKRWGDFSIPRKWNEWKHDGTSFKTSYVFTVTNLDLSA